MGMSKPSLESYLAWLLRTAIGRREFPDVSLANLNKERMEGFYTRWDVAQSDEEKEKIFEDICEYLKGTMKGN